MRAVVLAGCGAALTAGLVACSSGSKPAAPAHPLGAGATVAAGSAAAGGDSDSGPGVAAASLKCDQFAATDVQAAAQQKVASATVASVPVSDSGGSDGGLTCDYNVYTPGADITSADRGMAQVTLSVADVWGDTPITGTDDDAHQKEGFEADRQSAQSANNGQAENNATSTYHDVSGVGAGAFLVDTVHTDDGGAVSQYNAVVSALRDPSPYKVEVSIDYVVPQPDQALADKLDAVMRDEAGRAAVVQAIATSLLAKFS